MNDRPFWDYIKINSLHGSKDIFLVFFTKFTYRRVYSFNESTRKIKINTVESSLFVGGGVSMFVDFVAYPYTYEFTLPRTFNEVVMKCLALYMQQTSNPRNNFPTNQQNLDNPWNLGPHEWEWYHIHIFNLHSNKSVFDNKIQDANLYISYFIPSHIPIFIMAFYQFVM